MTQASQCWCGNIELTLFSPTYLKCQACDTLVLADIPESEALRVTDDQHDFYGRAYYDSHLTTSYGYPALAKRARTDIPERCLHWLRTLLKYKLPPAKALELGSAHGGFVALLQWAGFEATGLEMSPSVAHFARQAFAVPMLVGPIEEQQVAPETLDVIALMDVLEHVVDPVGVMHQCLSLLKPDGLLILQTPCLPEAKTYEEMVAQDDRFLEQLKEKEHLYLFSQRSVREFFRRLGATYLQFEPAIFAHYDMSFVVSRSPLPVYPTDALIDVLSATPSGRLVQALLDTSSQLCETQQCFTVSEADRVARLATIEQQGQDMSQLQAQVHQWLQEHHTQYSQALALLERQGEDIAQWQVQVQRGEQEKQALRAELATLRQHFEAAEADRVARLATIEQQGQDMSQLQAQVHQWLQEHHTQYSQALALLERQGEDIAQWQVQVQRGEQEKQALRAELATLRQHFEAAEADRVARLATIEQQGQDMSQLQAQVHQWLQEHHTQYSQALALLERQGEDIAQWQVQVQRGEQEKQALRAELATLRQHFEAAEADRVARLATIEQQGQDMSQLQAQVHQWLQEHHTQYSQALALLERQGEDIAQWQVQVQYGEQEKQALRAELATLRQHFEAAEADRAARLTVIEQQGGSIAHLQAQVHHGLQENARLRQQYEILQHILQDIEHTRAYRLLRRLGCWRFMAQTASQPLNQTTQH